MTIFNPQVPQGNDNMPNYFKYSEPIKAVEADTSTGTALKTLGTGIEGAAELADTTVKGIIKNDTYDRVDAERQSFTGFLDATLNPTQPVTGDNAPVDLMARGADAPPTAISRGINKIGTAQAGLDGNKIDETMYYQRVGNIAKDLRATYPGYRDYIDKEVSKITGVDPANAYITGIIAKINTQASNANKDRDYWEKQIVSNVGFPQSEQILANFKATGDSTPVMHWLATNQGPLTLMAAQKAAFDQSKNDKTDQMTKASDLADSTVLHAATIGFTNQKLFGGVAPSDIADKMTQASLHPELYNDEFFRNLGAQYEAMRTQVYNTTAAQLNARTKGPDGKLLPSVADILGPTETKKRLDDGIGLLFNKTSEFIHDKQLSPAYALQTSAEAVASNAFYKALTDPTLKGRVLTAAALNKAAPNASPIVLNQLLGKGLQSDLATFTTEQGRQALGQPENVGKYQGADGNFYSIRQAIEEQKNGATLTGRPITGQVMNNLIQVKQFITDPNMDAQGKANAIKFLYDPKINKGVMDNFMNDYYDPTKGTVVKGRESAFASLTSEDVTKAVWDHAQKNGQNAWLDYSKWAKGEFGTQLRNQIIDIDKINKEANRPDTDFFSTSKPPSAYKVSWDSDNHQFILKNKDGTELNTAQSLAARTAVNSVSSVNQGLRNMATIAKTEGSNVDAYIFKTLKNSGFTPTKDVDGIPAQLMRSMIISNGGKLAPAANAPTVPVSKFAEEKPQGDLQAFLTNPAGSQGRTTPSQSGPGNRGVIRGNLSDETLLNIRTDDIPEGMDARTFIRQLQGKK